MRLPVPIFFFITFFSTSSYAQVVGYGIAGPATTVGFVTHSRITFNAGAGGEVFLAKYFTVGGEGGMFDRLITVSANGGLHVVSADDRMAPFISGGYSRIGIGDGDGGFDTWNVGAGADAWIGNHAGLRFELRDYIRPDDRGSTHYLTFRIGVVFGSRVR